MSNLKKKTWKCVLAVWFFTLLVTVAHVQPTQAAVKLNATSMNLCAGERTKLSLTGTMDEDTVAAVKKFQKEAGMCPYGGLDYGTMATLERYVMQYLSGETVDRQLEKAVELLKK